VEIDSELVTSLSAFGLSDKLARLYLILLKYGPKTLMELIKLTDSYRQDVQRNLEQLSDNGLIEISLAKPTAYTAVPIKAAFNAVVLKHQADNRAMEELMPKVIDRVHTFTSKGEPVSERCSPIQGVKEQERNIQPDERAYSICSAWSYFYLHCERILPLFTI